MKPWNASGPYTAIALCLLAVSGLTACKQASTRPETAPTPPLVACEAGPAETIPPIPDLWGMDAWAAEVLGIIEREYIKRGAEHACLANLRTQGVIL